MSEVKRTPQPNANVSNTKERAREHAKARAELAVVAFEKTVDGIASQAASEGTLVTSGSRFRRTTHLEVRTNQDTYEVTKNTMVWLLSQIIEDAYVAGYEDAESQAKDRASTEPDYPVGAEILDGPGGAWPSMDTPVSERDVQRFQAALDSLDG